MKKTSLIFIIVGGIIIVGVIAVGISIFWESQQSSQEEKFKELTKAYETLMSDDDQEFQDLKQKIDNYIGSSEQFKEFPKDRKPEREYYEFGKIFKVEELITNQLDNPHLVAKKNLYQCLNGNTDNILKIIPIVETDRDLAKSLMYYIDDFCKLRNECLLDKEDVYIKFVGIIHKKDVSVWYYYITDQSGHQLLNNSWISLHCSNNNGLCSLMGVFFNSKECSPEGVINTEKDYAVLPYNELDTK